MTDAAALTDQQLADIRSRFERTTHPGWQDTTDTGRLLAEVDRLRAELAATRRRSEIATGRLLHFAAEAHRRKWAYDNGAEGPTPAAFAVLHQLGDEMRAAVDAITAAPSD